MPTFLELPRELRDLIYDYVITWEHPGPAPPREHYRKVTELQSSLRGEYGCAYSVEAPPQTTANVLCCNRQLHDEMSVALDRAERRHDTIARMECIAEDESFHRFHWKSLPLVRTEYARTNLRTGLFNVTNAIQGLLTRLRPAPSPFAQMGSPRSKTNDSVQPAASTTIPHLHMDIHLTGDRWNKSLRNSSPPDRTSWAICAALSRLVAHGPTFFPPAAPQSSHPLLSIFPQSLSRSPPTPVLASPSPGSSCTAIASCASTKRSKIQTTISCLTLNVLTPSTPVSTPTFTSTSTTPPNPTTATTTTTDPSTITPKLLPTDCKPSAHTHGIVHPLTVAQELLDVWASIWAGTHYKAALYTALLERIGSVEVCVDGMVVGERSLRGELERGRKALGMGVRGVGDVGEVTW